MQLFVYLLVAPLIASSSEEECSSSEERLIEPKIYETRQFTREANNLKTTLCITNIFNELQDEKIVSILTSIPELYGYAFNYRRHLGITSEASNGRLRYRLFSTYLGNSKLMRRFIALTLSRNNQKLSSIYEELVSMKFEGFNFLLYTLFFLEEPEIEALGECFNSNRSVRKSNVVECMRLFLNENKRNLVDKNAEILALLYFKLLDCGNTYLKNNATDICKKTRQIDKLYGRPSKTDFLVVEIVNFVNCYTNKVHKKNGKSLQTHDQ